MIFVSLGTQDKPFKRLIDYLENSKINDEIIVQAGFTEYSSDKLKIFKYLPKEDFDNYLKNADYVICHGGVGTIVSSINDGKKVLAVPRLSKYGEHQNDHQLQIVNAYYQKGYILMMNDGDDFDKKIEELKLLIRSNFPKLIKLFLSSYNNKILM